MFTRKNTKAAKSTTDQAATLIASTNAMLPGADALLAQMLQTR